MKQKVTRFRFEHFELPTVYFNTPIQFARNLRSGGANYLFKSLESYYRKHAVDCPFSVEDFSVTFADLTDTVFKFELSLPATSNLGECKKIYMVADMGLNTTLYVTRKVSLGGDVLAGVYSNGDYEIYEKKLREDDRIDDKLIDLIRGVPRYQVYWNPMLDNV